jgi:hypothetical protein
MTTVYDYRVLVEHAPALRESASPDLFALNEQIRAGKRQENPLRKSIRFNSN